MITRTGFCLLVAALATGCVSSSGSDATSTTGAGTTGSGGAGGAGTTTGDGTGGGESCGGVQLASATFKLDLDGAVVPNQPLPANEEWTVEGQVVASSPETVVINRCPPGMSCPITPATLTVTAPDLPSVLAPPGAWVRLRLRVDLIPGAFTPGTSTLALVENLPDWMGSPNPISTTNRVWFAAYSDNIVPSKLPAGYLPYEVQKVLCSSCWTGNEAWRITFPGLAPVDVLSGAQVAFDVTGAIAAHCVFQALSANHTCESYGTGSYWLLGT
jgi:hypothetical protein